MISLTDKLRNEQGNETLVYLKAEGKFLDRWRSLGKRSR